MTKPTSVQWIFGPKPSSFTLAPKGLCTSKIIRHPICKIFLYQFRYERFRPVKNITKIMYISIIKVNYTISWRLDEGIIFGISAEVRHVDTVVPSILNFTFGM